jgi:hypothetical protein
MANFDVGINIKALDEFSQTFATLNKQFASVQNSVQKTESKLERFGAKMKNIGRSLSLRLTAPIMAGAGYAFKQMIDFDTMNEQLLRVTGSTEKAKIAFQRVKDISESTGWNPEEIATITSRFMGLGNTLEDAAKKTEIYSKVVLGSKHSLTDLSSLMLRAEAMSKKAGKGQGAFPMRSAQMLIKYVPAIAIEMQKAGIAAGKTAKQVMDAFEAGTISVDLVNEALGRVAANTHGLSIEQNMMRIHNILRYFVYDAAEAVFGTEDMKTAMDRLGDKLKELEDKFGVFAKAHPEIIKITAGFIGVLAVLGPIAMGIGAISNACIVLGTVLKSNIMPYVLPLYALVKGLLTLRGINFGDVGADLKKVGEMLKKGDFKGIGRGLYAGAIATEKKNSVSDFIMQSMGGSAIPQNNKVETSSQIALKIDDPKGYVKDVTKRDSNQKTNFNLGYNMWPALQ